MISGWSREYVTAKVNVPVMLILLFGALVIALCGILVVNPNTGQGGEEGSVASYEKIVLNENQPEEAPAGPVTGSDKLRERIAPDPGAKALPYYKEHEDLQGIVLDLHETPIGGARVKAVRLEYFGRRIAPRDYRVLKTVSGADGRFRFEKILPGKYSLSARQQDLAGAAYARATSPDSDPSGTTKEWEVILQPAGAIEGRVLNSDGDPVKYVKVIPTAAPAALTGTDAEGRFRLKELSSGIHTICACAEGYAPAMEEDVLTGTVSLDLILSAGGVVTGSATLAGKPVSGLTILAEEKYSRGLLTYQAVTGGDGVYTFSGLPAKFFELRLDSPAYSAPAQNGVRPREGKRVARVDFHLVKNGVVTGRVIAGETSAPLGDVWVTVFSTKGRGGANRTPSLFEDFPLPKDRANTRTNAVGAFTLSCLAPGEYYLGARGLSGYSPGLWKEGGRLIIRQGERHGDLVISLEKGLPATVEVTGEDGSLILGADLTLKRSYTGQNNLRSRAESELLPAAEELGDGCYAFQGLPEGVLNVAVQKRNWSRHTAALVLTRSEATQPLKIVLSPAHTLEGIVVGPEGQGIVDACVSYSGSWQAMTDPNGRFVLNGLPSRLYGLKVEAEGYLDHQESNPVFPGNKELLLEMTPVDSHRIGGRVLDDQGQALAGVSLFVSQHDGNNHHRAKTESGSDGRFVFRDLSDLSVNLSADTDLGTIRGTNCDLQVGRTDLEIVIERFARVKGTVVDQKGNPAAFFYMKSRSLPSSKANEYFQDGAFDIEQVRAGKTTLQALTLAGDQVASESLELAPGEVREGIRMTLLPMCTLEGVVYDEITQEPVADASLWVIDEEKTKNRSTLSRYTRNDSDFATGPDGIFRIDNLSVGRVVVVAKHPDYTLAQSAPVELFQGETTQGVEISMGKGGIVTGYVYVDGSPESGIRVTASGENRERNYAYTGSDGLYKLDNLPQGVNSVGAELKNKQQSGGVTTSRELTVDSGGMGRCDFFLATGNGLEGRISVEGQPRGDVHLSLSSKREDPPATLSYSGWAQSGVDGVYRLEGVPPGSYHLYVYSYGEQDLRESRDVEIQGVTRLDIDLGNAGTGEVRGYIYENNQPLSGAVVYIWGENLNKNIQTDASGYYQFSKLPEGRINLRAYLYKGESKSKSGFYKSFNLTLESGGLIAQDFHFSTGSGRISGRVLANNEPVRYASIVLQSTDQSSDESPRISVRCSNGEFLAEGLLPGRYRVGLFRPWSMLQYVDVVHNGEARVDFSYEQGTASVNGRLETPNQEMAAGDCTAYLFLPGTCSWRTGQSFSPLGQGDGLQAALSLKSNGQFQQKKLPARAFDLVAVCVKDDKVIGLGIKQIVLREDAATEVSLVLAE